jgi:hypothetical protein
LFGFIVESEVYIENKVENDEYTVVLYINDENGLLCYEL